MNLMTETSAHSVSDTMDRLENLLKEKGLGVVARVDHSAAAQKAGLELPPTQVMIFGNPKLGTPLMQAAPSLAIDLPMKMLVAENPDGSVQLSWTDPQHLKNLHQVSGCDELFETMGSALKAIASAACS